MLRELWKLMSEGSAESVRLDMAGVGSFLSNCGNLVVGTTSLRLRLHDLAHDFALQESKKYGKASIWPTA